MSNQEGDRQNPRDRIHAAPHANDPTRADLKAYLDHELSPLQRWRVRRHVAGCAECREEVAWLQRLGEDMRDLEHARPRPELRARILASLPDTPPAPASNGHRLHVLRPLPETHSQNERKLAFGAIFAVLALAGIYVASHIHFQPHQPVYGAGVPSPASSSDVAVNKTPAPTPVAQLYPPDVDKINAWATRIQEEEEREARRRRAHPLHRSGPSRPEPDETRPPVRLAFAVADVSAAGDRLQALTLQYGGEVFRSQPLVPPASDVHTSSAAPPPPAASDPDGGGSGAGSAQSGAPVPDALPGAPASAEHPSAPAAPRPTGHLFAMRIPAAQIQPFLAALRGLGTAVPLPPSPAANASGGNNAPSATSAPSHPAIAVRAPTQAAPGVPTGPEPQATPTRAAPGPSPAPAAPSLRRRAVRLVTVVVELQPRSGE